MDTPEGARDPLADTPLFRELQRVLLAGSGPVNWELARQVGIAMTSLSEEDPEPSEDDRRGLEGAVRMAELAVGELTGLSGSVTRVEAVRRAGWVDANVRGLRELFEPAASRLAALLRDARQREMPESAEGGTLIEAMLGQLGPLLMGAQVGTVLGQLGKRVLGQYELPVPRSEPGLLFVVPNIAAFEREWSLDADELRAWVALHETTHAITLGRPWVREHVLRLIREVAEGMEFDLEGLEARLAGLDMGNPEALSEAIGDPSDLLRTEATPERRLLVARLQAFMAVAEGHADHVMRIVGRERLPSYARIEEAIRRRHEGRGSEERMVDRLLGLELKAEHYRLGAAFCDRVAEATDEVALARMWDSAEALPSMPELEEPTLWLARTA